MPALPLPRQQRQQGPGAQASGWRRELREEWKQVERCLKGRGPGVMQGGDECAAEDVEQSHMRPKVGFWAAARSVPTVMMMKPASSPRAAAGNRYLELFSPRAA